MKNLFLALAFILTSSFVFANDNEYFNEDNFFENHERFDFNYSVSSTLNTFTDLSKFIFNTAQLCLVSVSVTEVGPYGFMYTHTLEYYTFSTSDSHCDLINDVVQSDWENGLY